MTSGDLGAQVDALGAALVGVRGAVAADLVRLETDTDVLAACRALAALRARTDAAYLAVVAEVDRRRAASGTTTGATGGTVLGSTTEGLLRTAALLSAGQARRDVAAAHALHGRTTDRGDVEPAVLPALAEQLGDGSITREHVDVAVRCLDRVPRHLTGSGDRGPGGGSPVTTGQLGAAVHDVVVGFVCEAAGLGTARDLDRACRLLLDRLDPDAGDRFDPLAHERRFLDLSTDTTGMLVGRFQLDPAAGLALRAALDAHSAPTPSQDGLRDPRPARQRRADALGHLAAVAAAAADPVRGEPVRVVVHVTPGLLRAGGRGAGHADQVDGPPWSSGPPWSGDPPWSLAGWAESGGRVGRAVARRLSCDAVLQRLVAAPSAGPLELGREVRLASRTQRRALAARDRGCVVPGCGAQPQACDAHHVRHWADGGATDLHNLVLLCGSHHTAVHAGTWSVSVADDGVPEVVAPRWADPHRRPRRLWHHHVDAAVARSLVHPDVAAPSPVRTVVAPVGTQTGAAALQLPRQGPPARQGPQETTGGPAPATRCGSRPPGPSEVYLQELLRAG